ncbi:MAG: hypothetical protein IM464_05565, partial [Microcystis sp. M037S2]|nr:hypothetical protein [Microcystis sp. M037S2]
HPPSPNPQPPPKNFFSRPYLDRVAEYWSDACANLPSYQHFVEWIPATLIPLSQALLLMRFKKVLNWCTKIGHLKTLKTAKAFNFF